MKTGEIIRARRKEQNLTQDQLAEYLGVSAAAVSKWENDSTYPDITLLAPLARLLKTDLNTLLAFREEITEQEIGRIGNEVVKRVQEESYEAGFEMAMEKIREYPACDRLIGILALTLEGALMLRVVPKQEYYRNEIEKLYERAAAGTDIQMQNQMKTMLISRYLEREEYDRAQMLLDEMPDRTEDKRHLQARLWREREEPAKAAALLEEKLMSDVSGLFLTLMSLLEIAVEQQDLKRADRLADQITETWKMYGLWWEYAGAVAKLTAAAAAKDREACLKLIRDILKAVKKPFNCWDYWLYQDVHIPESEKGKEPTMEKFVPTLLEGLKKSENLEFLWEDPEFQALLSARTS